MSALPDYASWAVSRYLEEMSEHEAQQARLDAQIAIELRSRETWEQGMAEAAIEFANKPNPILTALMAEDFTEAGRLTYSYIVGRFAKEQAENSIARQDEDEANDFLVG